jgi:alkylation response protein AidB-like acyl-CoA dehydrogenase
MNLDFSDEQNAARDEIRRLLAARPGLESARRSLDGVEPYDRTLWTQLGRDGWLGAAIPRRYGGQELGYEMLCGIAEEIGRSMAAVPFGACAVFAMEALIRGGSGAQQIACLPALARGELIGAVALAEGCGALRASGLRTTYSAGVLNGTKIGVSDGMSADFLLVLGESAGEAGLYLVEANAPGVRRAARSGMDPAHAPARIQFDDVRAEPLPELCGWSGIETLLDRVAVILAFEQLGAAEAALELATAYARSRHAFGRPIGSFQAIKHKLADVYIANALARSNAYYAAWALASGAPTLALAAAAARVSASEALERAARELIQVHGGIAVTWEHDAHLFYRRAQHLGVMVGGLREWQHRLVAELERAA